MQRFCEGCKRYHDLDAFDLDSDALSAVCRAHSRAREKSSRASAGRRRQTKIEALEQRRRGLIVALVRIDQEIARERALRASTPQLAADAADVFGTDGDSCD